MIRDLSQKQLEKRLGAFGITKPAIPFMGYWNVPTNTGMINVSAWNAGPRRRDQLAYLTREQARIAAWIVGCLVVGAMCLWDWWQARKRNRTLEEILRRAATVKTDVVFENCRTVAARKLLLESRN